jgi:hypothetical protein
MVDLNALLTPSMSDMTSLLLTLIVPMVFRHDLHRMSDDEVDLLSIMGWIFSWRSDDLRPPLLDLVLHVTFACKIFLYHP